MGLDNLPEAYAKGQVNFLGAQIDLTNRPFIPREETEFWVEKAIKEIKVFSKKQFVVWMFLPGLVVLVSQY